MKRLASLPIALASLALAGCISFGEDPPASLLTLTPVENLPAAVSRTASAGEAITVVTPAVPQALQTQRVPVHSSDTEIAYLKNAQWVTTPDELFRGLLSNVIAATTGRVVLDPLQFSFDPGTRLTGRLEHFGLDARTMQALVVYDAALALGDNAVETRRFEARVPVTAAETAYVAPALNQAANQVASEVAAWLAR